MCRWLSASLPPWRQVGVAFWRGSVTSLFWFLVVVGCRVARGTTAAAPERIELAIDLFYCIPKVDAVNRRFKAVVLEASADHVGRCRSVVIAGLAIDALAFIAAVVDAFPASARLEHCVRQFSPPLACALFRTRVLALKGTRHVWRCETRLAGLKPCATCVPRQRGWD
jgi:hypothetical protein